MCTSMLKGLNYVFGYLLLVLTYPLLHQEWSKQIQVENIEGKMEFGSTYQRGVPKISRLTNRRFTIISSQISAIYINIFHKTEIQTVILRCLVCLNLKWIKSNNAILVKIFIFSCLEIHYFRASLSKEVLTLPKETSSHIFKMAIFANFFGDFMNHIIR